MSPLLSNLYLHEVLDVWFEHEAKPRLRGRAFEVSYADDAVLVFEHEEDARRVRAVLAKRRERYGLRLHPDKHLRGGTQRGPASRCWGSPIIGDAPGRGMGGKAQDCQGLPPA